MLKGGSAEKVNCAWLIFFDLEQLVVCEPRGASVRRKVEQDRRAVVGEEELQCRWP